MTRLHGRDGEAGNATVGMVVVVPIIMMMALLIVGLGRTVAAQQSVTAAARSAARAGSLADTPAGAAAAVTQAAEAALAGRCSEVTITPNLSDFAPGGEVAVEVTCRISLSDTALAGLPGHATLSASSSAAIEQLRRVGT